LEHVALPLDSYARNINRRDLPPSKGIVAIASRSHRKSFLHACLKATRLS
jgi:hypothetical protein